MARLVKAYPGRDESVMVFHCPACKDDHHVTVGGIHGWDWNGDVDSPSLSPSIRVTRTVYERDGNGDPIPETVRQVDCHTWMTDGRLKYFPDCYHEMAGMKWIEMPEIRERESYVDR